MYTEYKGFSLSALVMLDLTSKAQIIPATIIKPISYIELIVWSGHLPHKNEFDFLYPDKQLPHTTPVYPSEHCPLESLKDPPRHAA